MNPLLVFLLLQSIIYMEKKAKNETISQFIRSRIK